MLVCCDSYNSTKRKKVESMIKTHTHTLYSPMNTKLHEAPRQVQLPV